MSDLREEDRGRRILRSAHRARAEACRASFLSVFPDDGGGRGLVDCIDGDFPRPLDPAEPALRASACTTRWFRDRSPDASSRSSRAPPDPVRAPHALAEATRAYRGRYEGGPAERDSAYHQGTVWPWLIGAVRDGLPPRERREARRRAKAIRALLGRSEDFLLGDGLGQLPEIFDGDAPHRPRGCVAQAWSVAELCAQPSPRSTEAGNRTGPAPASTCSKPEGEHFEAGTPRSGARRPNGEAPRAPRRCPAPRPASRVGLEVPDDRAREAPEPRARNRLLHVARDPGPGVNAWFIGGARAGRRNLCFSSVSSRDRSHSSSRGTCSSRT